MPVLTGASCLASESCPVVPLPPAPSFCARSILSGGLNDIYAIPCTEELTEVNLLDPDWWQHLIDDGLLGNIGVGIGSIKKKATKTDKAGSETLEEITMITWGAAFKSKRLDATVDDVTKTQADLLIQKASTYLFIVRMSQSDNAVLPIGKATLSDFDWDVPEDVLDPQSVAYELTWNELGKPKVYNVAGLSAILPKSV